MSEHDSLTQAERIDLKEKLQLIAEWYFTKEEVVKTCCGICSALYSSFKDSNYYQLMNKLLVEIQGYDYLANYTDTYEDWEGRAYMCLILVEYLDTTIDATNKV